MEMEDLKVGDLVIIDAKGVPMHGFIGEITAILGNVYHEPLCKVCFREQGQTCTYEKRMVRKINQYERSLHSAGMYICSDINAVLHNKFEIEKVIFNDPATIVIWKDGTKTVVKCGNDDIYDTEKGLALAIAKKALGNEGNYYEIFKRWLPEREIDDMMKFWYDLDVELY